MEKGLECRIVLFSCGGGHQDIIDVNKHVLEAVDHPIHEPLERLGRIT